MQWDFKGQRIIVTGGTRGIGRGVSEAFLKAGASVIATYRSNEQAAQQFKESQSAHGDRLDVQSFDVARYDDVEAFFQYVEKTYGAFQVLVHSSGIRSDAVVGLMKAEDWQGVIETNLSGTFHACKFAVQNLMRQRYGRIVIVTSPVGRFGFAGQSNYAASKAGQVAFARSLSKEVASRKITVNCVSPGFIDTEFIADLPEEQRKSYRDLVPLKRFGTTEEVAQSVLFLASKEAAYITGSVLEVAGGL